METDLQDLTDQLQRLKDLVDQLERAHRKDQAHIESLQSGLAKTQKENSELSAQARYVRSTAERSLKEMNDLVEALWQRIEVMVKAWEAQICSDFKGTKKRKKELLAIVAPFRPERLGVASEGEGKLS